MVINIIDSGMSSYAGHHADINLRVAREIKSRGHQVKLYANTMFPLDSLDLDVIHFDEINPYHMVEYIGSIQSITHQAEAFKAAAAIFGKKLQKVDPANLTIFPTLFDYQLYSIGTNQAHLGQIVGCIHSDPNQFNKNGYLLWNMAFNICSLGIEKLMLGTIEPELLPVLQKLTPFNRLNLNKFPIPHDGSLDLANEKQLITIGILGHQRNTKGVDSIPHVATNLLNLGCKVIVQDSSLSGLLQQLSPHPNLEVIGRVENMGDLINRCSLILLNYNPQSYIATGSGIAWEALATGIPILAPKNTTMAKLIANFSCGDVFDYEDNASIYIKIELMKKNYLKYQHDSKLARYKYQSLNGTKKFVDYIFLNIAF
jgi:glycosyltransferase involved in cell wall biosynthesis